MRSGDEEARFEAAYDRLLPENDALPASALVVINIDVPSAVTSALGAWKEISTHRSELAATLQDFNAAQFDKQEAYALATGHAHALFMAASAPAGLFREKWSALYGKTLLQASELKNAQLLADRLISAVGDRVASGCPAARPTGRPTPGPSTC